MTGEEYLFNHSFWTPVGLQVMFGDAQRALEMKENELSGKLDHMQDQLNEARLEQKEREIVAREATSMSKWTEEVQAAKWIGPTQEDLANRLGALIEEANGILDELRERGCAVDMQVEEERGTGTDLFDVISLSVVVHKVHRIYPRKEEP